MEQRITHRAYIDPRDSYTYNRFESLPIESTVEDNEEEFSHESYVRDQKVTKKIKRKTKKKVKTKNTQNKKQMQDKINEDYLEDIIRTSVSISSDESSKNDLVGSNLLVNNMSLLPEDLLVMQVTVDNVQTKALIDTGASRNLIKKSIASKLGLNVGKESHINFEGLGNEIMNTYGVISPNVFFYSIDAGETLLHVVDDNIIKYPIILGQKFCLHNKLIIDIANRRISKSFRNGSKLDIYLDGKNGNVETSIQKSIKVYAKSDYILNEGINKVPIEFNYMSIPHLNQDETKLYYEGTCNNKNIEGIDGVFSLNQENKHIFVKPLTTNKEKKYYIKKGDILGKLSTIVQLDEDDEQEEETEWTLSKLKEKINMGEKVNDEGKNKIYDMLMRTKLALSRDDSDIGLANVTPHKILLTNETPIWQKHRRFAEPVTKEIERQCKELEALDIIEECNSRWSSPVVPIRKADGTLRLCVDYRRINQVTIPENFPMPNITDSIYSAHDIKYFTKIDLTKGYYQVPIDDDSKKYTSFTTQNNQYQFKRLSFGLKNSGLQFQRNIQEILSGFNSKKVIIYIDDILIISKDFDEHLTMTEKVLFTLLNNGIKIKVSKCEFFKEKVSFLGHIISKEGIEKSPEYIEKVKNFPKPRNVNQMRRFLGLANFQRKFVDHFSEITKTLTPHTSGNKKKTITWTDKMNEAFDKIKEKLAQETKLSYPDYGKNAESLELFVDASGLGAGACLVQKQENVYKTIAYSSKTFSAAEQKYAAIDRELLALRWGVKIFRPFLFGVSFVIHTDHKPLIYLQNMSNENSRLARTMNDLQDYDFVIKYRPGPDNEAADTLSRIMEYKETDTDIIESKLPIGYKVMEVIPGGGDSMFISLLSVLEDLNRLKGDINIPLDHLELRKQLVRHLLANASKFNIKLSNNRKKEIKAMEYGGVLPCHEIFVSTSDFYNLEIRIHYGMSSPVVYKTNEANRKTRIIHLQCLAGIHFNPVMCIRNKNENIPDKNINIIYLNNINDEENKETDEINILVENHKNLCKCKHRNEEGAPKYVVSIGDITFCSLIDTGAQVSIITEDIWDQIKSQNIEMDFDFKEVNHELTGIGNQKVPAIGIVKLKLDMLGMQTNEVVPFAVIKNNDKPWCSILGANFLKLNKMIVDFEQQMMYCESNEGDELIYPMQLYSRSYTKNINFFGNLYLEDDSNTVSDSECNEWKNKKIKIKYTIDEKFYDIQINDHALNALKLKITDNIDKKKWKEPFLNQFKRYSSQLIIKEDILWRQQTKYVSIVLPFPMIVDIAYKTHTKLGHIGRHKLLDIILKNFWHPSLENICRDICSSCYHCQFYKVHKRETKPPMLKIETSYPFQMVAMDCMSLQTTNQRNVALLVAIDHYSKWMNAVPIKNKTTNTVINSVKNIILPSFVRTPDKILTDNGPEFKSSDFNSFLKSMDIKHVYSTPNKPSSNGCVERTNRTIIQLLKGVCENNPETWDKEISEVVRIYNNTIHSQTKKSPSDLLLLSAHSCDKIITTESTWRVGNPKYSPYCIGQKVLRKIHKTGNKVTDKLKPKFEGPFLINKIQPNNVTYELKNLNNLDAQIKKEHHDHLKPFREIPEYLSKFIVEPKLLTYQPEIKDILSSESEEFSGFLIGDSDDASAGEETNNYNTSKRLVLHTNNNMNEKSDILYSNSTSTDDKPADTLNKGNNNFNENNKKVKYVVTTTDTDINHDEYNSQNKNSKSKIRSYPKLNMKPTENIVESEETPITDYIDQFDKYVKTIKFNTEFKVLSPRKELHEFYCSEAVECERNYDNWATSTPVEKVFSNISFSSGISEENNSERTKTSKNSISELSENYHSTNKPPVLYSNMLEVSFIEVMNEAWVKNITVLENEIDDILEKLTQSNIKSMNIKSKITDSEEILGYGLDFDTSVNKTFIADDIDSSFGGFQTMDDDESPAKHLKVLKGMLSHSIKQKRIINGFKRNSNEFLRNIRSKCMNSETTSKGSHCFSDKEEMNVLVPQRGTNDPTPRTTRSRGSTGNFPNVQPRILKYGLRSRNIYKP